MEAFKACSQYELLIIAIALLDSAKNTCTYSSHSLVFFANANANAQKMNVNQPLHLRLQMYCVVYSVQSWFRTHSWSLYLPFPEL